MWVGHYPLRRECKTGLPAIPLMYNPKQEYATSCIRGTNRTYSFTVVNGRIEIRFKYNERIKRIQIDKSNKEKEPYSLCCTAPSV